MIFHRKLILHFEVHRGYRPRLSAKLEPKLGARAYDGGLTGTLLRCPACSGDGYLLMLDELPEVSVPESPRIDPKPPESTRRGMLWDGDFPGNPGGYADPWGR